ncbi:hypothetical protein [Murdochiella massiliensis]|nr:hypothetical protein [Murdochiella massiliensis]
MSIIVDLMAKSVIAGRLTLDAIGNVGNLHDLVAARVAELQSKGVHNE